MSHVTTSQRLHPKHAAKVQPQPPGKLQQSRPRHPRSTALLCWHQLCELYHLLLFTELPPCSLAQTYFQNWPMSCHVVFAAARHCCTAHDARACPSTAPQRTDSAVQLQCRLSNTLHSATASLSSSIMHPHSSADCSTLSAPEPCPHSHCMTTAHPAGAPTRPSTHKRSPNTPSLQCCFTYPY